MDGIFIQLNYNLSGQLISEFLMTIDLIAVEDVSVVSAPSFENRIACGIVVFVWNVELEESGLSSIVA